MTIRLIKQGSSAAAKVQPLRLEDQGEAPEPLRDADRFRDEDPRRMAATPCPPAAPVSAVIPDPAPDLAQVERSAFESGFRQGERAGKEIAEKKMETIIRRYGDAIEELGKVKQALYVQVEREIVRLVVEVARKIVRREIQVDPEIVQTLVRVALDHAAEKSTVTVRLNPADVSFLHEKHPGWDKEVEGGREVVLVADKAIERGGCLLQTDCGDVDARIEEQFREVEQGFFEGSPKVGR